jgi:hypothetical protein
LAAIIPFGKLCGRDGGRAFGLDGVLESVRRILKFEVLMKHEASSMKFYENGAVFVMAGEGSIFKHAWSLRVFKATKM